VSELPAWLARATGSLGYELVAVEPVEGTDPFSGAIRTFRLRTADGQLLKARRAVSPASAARAQRLAARLAEPGIPEPLARHGSVTFERWIEGVTLDSLPLSEVLIEEAADLLAKVHSYPGSPRWRLPQNRSVGPVRVEISGLAARLRSARAIDRATSEELDAALRSGLPERAAWGLVHADFAASNMVLDAEGRLVSIDNEHLRWGFLDADLGRTWARWRLPAPAERRFLERYESSAGRTVGREALRAWRAVGALVSVAVRVRYGGRPEASLARLRDALDSAG